MITFDSNDLGHFERVKTEMMTLRGEWLVVMDGQINFLRDS
jgi:hypothetical protein